MSAVNNLAESKIMNLIINKTALFICILITNFAQADCNYINLDDHINVDDQKTMFNVHELLTRKAMQTGY